jgi:hypothetical protein
MKLVIALVVALSVLAAMPVLAGAPLPGNYKSINSDMAGGRFSESWYGGGQGQVGNTVHSMSWTAAGPTSEWEVWCPSLAQPPELISDNRDANGTGQVEYESVYEGGYFWLVGTGPWGNGDAAYTGSLEYYIHQTTFIFFNNVPISYTTNAEFAGTFDNYCMCILAVANAASVGNGSQPADYPSFLESDCSENISLQGEWGTVADITMTIFECASSTEESTWGSIKSLYR